MDSILVHGGQRLQGAIPISGAKNACLTLMPAALLTEEPVTLTNAPRLSDIRTMTTLLECLGCEVASLQQGRVLVIGTQSIANHRADYEIVRKMRASILVLGPMLARDGHAVVSLPGGCAIGARPVDLHLSGLEALGAELDLRDGYVHATAPRGLRGAVFEFPLVSVGATENLLMAATLARGTTVLKNAAREPEIVDLAHCLRRMGAQIRARAPRPSRSAASTGCTAPPTRWSPTASSSAPTCSPPRSPAARSSSSAAGASSSPPSPTSSRRRGSRSLATNAGLKVSRVNGRVARRRRDDRPLPRLPDRPAGADDGAAHPRRRGQPPRGAHLREPLHARPRAHPHGRAASRCTAAPPPSPASTSCAARR